MKQRENGCGILQRDVSRRFSFKSIGPDTVGLFHNDPRIAQAIIVQAGAEGVEVLSLNSMQAVTGSDIDGGASYLSLMEENIDALKEGMAA